MRWNDHWKLEGKHAYLGASKFHWIRYDEDKVRRHFENHRKAQEGQELHELAKHLIKKRIKVRGNHTFAAYVNDAIGFFMDPEVILMWDEKFFGTADAIKWDPDNLILRIHDLKTGIHPRHFDQLKLYAVLFFKEYGHVYRIKPHDVKIYLRIYQNDEVLQEIADPDEIVAYMKKAEHDLGILAVLEEAMS